MATETQVEVVMPQMGVSVSEGTITKWLKQEGEPIARDESLLEISTDKVDTEVPSPGEGVVAKILVQEGETVEVGTVLAVIAPEGAEVPTPAPAEAPPEPATQEASDAVRGGRDRDGGANATSAVADTCPASASTPVAGQADGNGRTFVSPVVARIASEHGVDTSAVQGTGAGGRVTKKDILAFVEGGGPAAASPAPQAAQSHKLPRLPPRSRKPRLRPHRPRSPRPRPLLRPHPLLRPRRSRLQLRSPKPASPPPASRSSR